MQTAKQFTWTGKQKLNYLLFLPQGYEGGGKKWPLLLFLHGAGERGSDLAKVAVHGPPKLVAKDPSFSFIVVSPQCPEGKIWNRDALAGLVEKVQRKYRVDRQRVYLTGLSMGGYGTWDLGFSYPEKFAAIVPICGGGNMITPLLSTPEKDKALSTIGIWAFHGGKDPVVPVSESERMVGLAKRRGAKDVKLTVYPEAGHDSWTETYKNPELYAWLLQHERKTDSGRLKKGQSEK
jgi:predicted peptidase